ncbi:MAG TPA: ABC transporter substrate-binding protein, partial [Actinomycetaceae bacterium]|nr:ABC transporter substrate-binding protein [Actinomycetaceae bacterium]
MTRRALALSAATATLLVLAACGSGTDPFDSDRPGGDSETPADDAGGTAGGDSEGTAGGDSDVGPIVIGSQAYYSNEIIAELYAQVLEDAGHEVTRNFQIGQRDAYLQAMAGGEVHLLPEYTGNLLQFYDPETEARSAEDVAAELPDALPDGLVVLDYAPAQDADSYNVTAEFAAEHGVASLADLADFDGEITIGGNAELEGRPYGPDGLQEYYGIEVSFIAIGDSGGPLTKQAIREGTITMGDIYSADPDLASGDFVTLDDPASMILAQNVVPLAAADVGDAIADVLAPVSEALTTEELIGLNARGQDEDT